MATKAHYSKLHHKIVHALPFVPSRKREKGYEVVRRWSNFRLEVYARETLNHYDLITLLLMVRRYIEGEFSIKGEHDGRKLVAMRFDLEMIVRERGLKNDYNNRKTLAESFLRFKHVDMTFKYDDGTAVASWLVYEVKYDEKSYRFAEVLMNERFLKYCVEAGILLNWRRLVAYGDNGVAAIVDTYLQGVKQRTRTGGGYKYRDWINEETLFRLIDPGMTREEKYLRRDLKEAFALMHKHGMPLYTYDRASKRFVRQCAIEDDSDR